MSAAPFTLVDGGVRIAVRLTPRGGGDRIDGAGVDSEGRALLLARVSAPPEGGKANAALLKLLSKTLGAPKSSLKVISGETSRVKIVEARGDATLFQENLRKILPI